MKNRFFAILFAATATISVMAATPVHRPLIEEYTGLWCGWCPRGIIALEMIQEIYGDSQVSLSYHVSDALAVTNTFPAPVNGTAPHATIDRGLMQDPYYGTIEPVDFGISESIDMALELPTIADISVEGELDYETGLLNVTSTSYFIESSDNANFKIGYALVSNNLAANSTNKWWQNNDYASYQGKPTFEGTPLEVLTTWPFLVRNLVFNDVVVDASATMGVNGSLPSTITANQEYVHHYSFNIARNTLVLDPNDLVIAAFVINGSTGKVINSNKYSFAKANGIDRTEAAEEIVATEYYNLSGVQVAHPTRGIFIRVDTLSSGAKKSCKVVI